MEFAHSLLLSIISSIAFIRGFFPESNFKDTLSPKADRSDHLAVHFKTLERGISPQADHLLDAIVFFMLTSRKSDPCLGIRRSRCH
jgi:hypothetical protein